jgi:hypothetical protein
MLLGLFVTGLLVSASLTANSPWPECRYTGQIVCSDGFTPSPRCCGGRTPTLTLEAECQQVPDDLLRELEHIPRALSWMSCTSFSPRLAGFADEMNLLHIGLSGVVRQVHCLLYIAFGLISDKESVLCQVFGTWTCLSGSLRSNDRTARSKLRCFWTLVSAVCTGGPVLGVADASLALQEIGRTHSLAFGPNRAVHVESAYVLIASTHLIGRARSAK